MESIQGLLGWLIAIQKRTNQHFVRVAVPVADNFASRRLTLTTIAAAATTVTAVVGAGVFRAIHTDVMR